MQYDPIKKSLGKVFNSSPFLRKTFYILLDILLLRAWHIKNELKAFKQSDKKVENIIDAGAGFGQYVFFMTKLFKNAKITAIDLKKEQVEDCNSFFAKIGKAENVQYIEGDLTKFISSSKVDCILCVDVMEHILEDEQVFANFSESLSKGGFLLISTPSDQGGSDVHDHDHEDSFVDEHVRDGYNMQDLILKLQNAGFENVSAKYSYGLPGNIAWKLSMKLPILMVNFTKLAFILLPFYYLAIMPICLILNLCDVNSVHKTGTGLIVKAYKK